LNLIAVLAAAVAMYVVGFLFYGVIFQQVWAQQTLENHGIVAPGEGASFTGEALMAELLKIPNQLDFGPALGLGFVISIVTAIGIGMVLRLAKPASMAAALRTAFICWAGFAATTLAYNVVYSSESRVIFGIDLLHLFIGYLIAAAVYWLIDGKTIRGS
jgi:hypothetical protein